eukprot:s964_g8.t1
MLNPGLTGLGLGLGLMTFDALAQATVSDWGQQWRNQVGKWEEESNIPPGLALWTGRKDFQGIGLPRTERALALVDLTCAQKVKDTGCSLRLIREQALIRLMSDCVLDISQNPDRRKFSKASKDQRCDNLLPCLTSSSRLYAYGQDRMLSGLEHFVLQGWSKQTLVAPEGVTENKLCQMAGQGMFMPSIGSILWALYSVKQFPG